MEHRRLRAGASRSGFTLIELLVAVAIISVLAMLAYPGYRHMVQRSQRAQAGAALLEASMYMERFQSLNHRYDLRLGMSAGDAAAPVALPPTLRQVPAEGRPHHRLVLGHVDAGSYRLEAHPIHADDECGVMTIDHVGRKGAGGPKGAHACW